MKHFWKLIIFSLLVVVFIGCAVRREQVSWKTAMREKTQRYQQSAKEKLYPYFKHAKVRYPPHELAFLIFKRSARLEVYAKNKKGRWKFIREFPVLAGSGVSGPKLYSGDRQVPEGIYHVVGLNPESRFDLSIHLNYPNAFDRQMAKLNARKHLGSDIFIHGNKRSVGCVAIGDKAIEQLFPLVYQVGLANVEVIIAPNDFRVQRPARAKVHPKWLPVLYRKIKQALKPFPFRRT